MFGFCRDNLPRRPGHETQPPRGLFVSNRKSTVHEPRTFVAWSSHMGLCCGQRGVWWSATPLGQAAPPRLPCDMDMEWPSR